MSSRIDPGIRVKELGGLYINFDGSKSKPVSRQQKEKKIQDEVDKTSIPFLCDGDALGRMTNEALELCKSKKSQGSSVRACVCVFVRPSVRPRCFCSFCFSSRR